MEGTWNQDASFFANLFGNDLLISTQAKQSPYTPLPSPITIQPPIFAINVSEMRGSAFTGVQEQSPGLFRLQESFAEQVPILTPIYAPGMEAQVKLEQSQGNSPYQTDLISSKPIHESGSAPEQQEPSAQTRGHSKSLVLLVKERSCESASRASHTAVIPFKEGASTTIPCDIHDEHDVAQWLCREPHFLDESLTRGQGEFQDDHVGLPNYAPHQLHDHTAYEACQSAETVQFYTTTGEVEEFACSRSSSCASTSSFLSTLPSNTPPCPQETYPISPARPAAAAMASPTSPAHPMTESQRDVQSRVILITPAGSGGSSPEPSMIIKPKPGRRKGYKVSSPKDARMRKGLDDIEELLIELREEKQLPWQTCVDIFRAQGLVFRQAALQMKYKRMQDRFGRSWDAIHAARRKNHTSYQEYHQNHSFIHQELAEESWYPGSFPGTQHLL